MSIINQMLRDLDARAAGEQERAGLPPRLRPLPPAAGANYQAWRMLALGVGLGALLAGIAAFLLLPAAPAVVPSSVAPAPAATPVPPVMPAPVTNTPPPVVDSGEMKISTLLSLTQPPEAERSPSPLPAATSLPRAPAVKAVTAPGASAAASPVQTVQSSPPAAMPAAASENLKPAPTSKLVPETVKPAPSSKPAPPPKVAAADTVSLDAQIDKRSKGGQGREMAETEYRKGMQAAQRGDNTAAVSLFRRALEFDPGYARARQALLSVLVSGRQWADAQQVAQNGLALDPAQAGWAMILARLQFEQGDASGAVATLEKHAAHAHADADYQGLFAYLLQKQQRPAEAAERFRAAVGLRPSEGRWWFGLGLALEGAGRGAEAREAFLKARETGSLSADMSAVIEQKLK